MRQCWNRLSARNRVDSFHLTCVFKAISRDQRLVSNVSLRIAFLIMCAAHSSMVLIYDETVDTWPKGYRRRPLQCSDSRPTLTLLDVVIADTPCELAQTLTKSAAHVSAFPLAQCEFVCVCVRAQGL